MQARFKHLMLKLFKANGPGVIDKVLEKVGPKLDAKASKAEDDEFDAEEFVDGLDLDFFEAVPGIAEPILKRAARNSSRQAYVQVGGNLKDVLAQVDEAAIAWAHDHAAEMVGRKWVEGELVDNPNAEYSIEESTRTMLREKIEEALEKGWTRDQLANEIESDIFSADRAELIAQTELLDAHYTSNMEGWRASGAVKGKKSLLSDDHEGTDECDTNAEQGVIDIDEDFDSGDDAPPFHPHCFCTVVAVLEPLAKGAESEEDDEE